ncbi:MAG TPA: RNA polymerase sigma factor [Chitinophagaceae bacterium]|nr:RNA polymerase sigma factor [Chitinophagaceae bacterium]
MDILSDNALMLKVKSGDLDKMALLFTRYHRALYGFLFHMTGRQEQSEDMVQDVFYRMLRSRHTFTGEGEFKTWMYHLARNIIKDYYRKNSRTGTHYEAEIFTEKLSVNAQAEEAMQKKMELKQLREAINNLDEQSREVLVLSRYQELKYNEIAQILGITEGAVKVRIHRAVNQLKSLYKSPDTKIA